MITGIELVQHHLREVVDVPVTSKVPTPRPEVFIRVDTTGVDLLSPVHQSTMITVQVYGSDLEQVLDLIQLCRMELLDRIEVTQAGVLSWEENTGPVDFPDPDIPQVFRWQLSGDLIHTLT